MNLTPALEKKYTQDKSSALQSQRLAQEIAFGPIVFQVSRLMVKFGILQLLDDHKEGQTIDEISAATHVSRYGVKLLLESSLTIGTVMTRDDKFFLTKAGWFLIHDEMVRVNMDFNHDVNYLGLFNLEESILNGRPEGLRVFGDWSTIYQGLSQLPPEVKKSWFAFDHYYSDHSFPQALEIVFASQPKRLLDVGGNTGKWAMQCVQYDKAVEVTIMDLPQQLAMMREETRGLEGADRISGHGCNILDPETAFPQAYDVIWMSQFLDCFSEEEIESILRRAAQSMSPGSKLFIMETFWDRQRFETAAYCLAQISVYFTALANGNSKMYHSADMERCVKNAGLQLIQYHDNIGQGHSIMECSL